MRKKLLGLVVSVMCFIGGFVLILAQNGYNAVNKLQQGNIIPIGDIGLILALVGIVGTLMCAISLFTNRSVGEIFGNQT